MNEQKEFCPDCSGSGRLIVKIRRWFSKGQTVRCDRCNGTGEYIEQKYINVFEAAPEQEK